MNISELSELLKLVGFDSGNKKNDVNGLSTQLGEKVIIRTYCSGVHFGTLAEKDGNEVILANSRRLHEWQCNKSLSLSGVATYGINQKKSILAPAVKTIWLEAIEIISVTEKCIESIETCEEYNEI